jgi:hypothetical protein
MVKCGDQCTPCCDFCVFAVHETWEDKELGGTVYGGPIHCEKHPDKKHDLICENCGYCEDFYCFKAESEKTRAERRHKDFQKAIRKKKITNTWNDGNDYYKGLHQFSKNKIHCSCPLCATKTRGKTAKKQGSAENWSIKDKKRIEDMKEQEEEE